MQHSEDACCFWSGDQFACFRFAVLANAPVSKIPFPVSKAAPSPEQRSPASRRGQDKRCFHKNTFCLKRFCYVLFKVRTCCHILQHICHILQHSDILCHMWHILSRECSSGGIAALLRRPGLSHPRLEAGEARLPAGARPPSALRRLQEGPLSAASNTRTPMDAVIHF